MVPSHFCALVGKSLFDSSAICHAYTLATTQGVKLGLYPLMNGTHEAHYPKSGGRGEEKTDLRYMELEASVWKTFHEVRKVKLYAENLFLTRESNFLLSGMFLVKVAYSIKIHKTS